MILILLLFLLNCHVSIQVRHQIMGTGLLADILTKKLMDIGEVDIVQVSVFNTSNLIPNILISSEHSSIDPLVNGLTYGQIYPNNVEIQNANFEKSTNSISLNLTRSVKYHFLSLNFNNIDNIEVNSVKVNSDNDWYFRPLFWGSIENQFIDSDSCIDPAIYVSQQFCNNLRSFDHSEDNFRANVKTTNYSVYYDEPGLTYCKSLQNSRVGEIYYPSRFYDIDIALNKSYIFREINGVNNWFPMPLFGNWSRGHDIIVAVDIINSTIDFYKEKRKEDSAETFIYIAISIIIFISCLFSLVLLINVLVIRKKSKADIGMKGINEGQ